ncbi:hypothetical protein D3C71_1238920 [compost metagenome]
MPSLLGFPIDGIRAELVEVLSLLDAGAGLRHRNDGLRHEVRGAERDGAGLVVASDRGLVPEAVEGLLRGWHRQVVLVEQDARADHHDGAALRGGAVGARASVARVDLPGRRGIDGLLSALWRGEQPPGNGGRELRASQVEAPQVAVGVAGVGRHDAAGGVPHRDHAAQAAVAAADLAAVARGELNELLELAGERLHHVQPDLLRFGVVAVAGQHDPGAVVQLARGGVVGHMAQVGIVLVLVVHFPEEVFLARGPVGVVQRRFQSVHERARASARAQHQLAPGVLFAGRGLAVPVVHILLDQRAVERVAKAEVRAGEVDLRGHGALGHERGQLAACGLVPAGIQHMDLAVVGGREDGGRARGLECLVIGVGVLAVDRAEGAVAHVEASPHEHRR